MAFFLIRGDQRFVAVPRRIVKVWNGERHVARPNKKSKILRAFHSTERGCAAIVATIMDTKRVGVRELKNDAPKFVQRAERGEEFVITRHGKAAAVLGPPVDAPRMDGRPRLEEWERERRAFERSKTKLLRKFRGRFVAMSGGAVVGSDRDAGVLFQRLARALDGRTFFIGRVGDAEPVLDMPGFLVE